MSGECDYRDGWSDIDESSLPERIRGYNWYQAFAYADPEVAPGSNVGDEPFDRVDVAEVLHCVDGEHDETPWVGVFKLVDGRYAYLSACCDYTGWDCRAGGVAYVSHDYEHLMQFGVPLEQRDRLVGAVKGGDE